MTTKDKKDISVVIKNLVNVKKNAAAIGLDWNERGKIDRIIKEQIELLSIESANEAELNKDLKKYNV